MTKSELTDMLIEELSQFMERVNEVWDEKLIHVDEAKGCSESAYSKLCQAQENLNIAASHFEKAEGDE